MDGMILMIISLVLIGLSLTTLALTEWWRWRYERKHPIVRPRKYHDYRKGDWYP
jgi:hypothetical protein